MTNPSLPQNNSPEEQQKRRNELTQAQAAYVYNHKSRLAPLGVAATLPKDEGFPTILGGSAILELIELVGNLFAKGSKLFGQGGNSQSFFAAGGQQSHPGGRSMTASELAEAEHVYRDLEEMHRQLAELIQPMHNRAATSPLAAPPPPTTGATSLGAEVSIMGSKVEAVAEGALRGGEILTEKIERKVEMDVEDSLHGRRVEAVGDPLDKLGDLIKSLIERLLSDAAKALFSYLGIYGEANNLYQFATLFQTLRLPAIASRFQDDVTFAWMRVAGPNPLVIRRFTPPDTRFPVTEEQYQAVMGAGDSLSQASAEGRLYLADYSALSSLVPGTVWDQQKYVEAPLALFAVPPASVQDRQLRAVAIQCSQAPGNQSPIFTPSDRVAWELAKLHVQVADANHHEMVSHLGQTHLLIEAFAMAVPRQLPPQHPLYVLLKPHFEGTLAINNGAESILIAPHGPVDILLAGTVASSVQLAVNTVVNLDFNKQMLPSALASRGVADARALPSYPYRDDALLVWQALQSWARSYLAVYYNTDQDVKNDYELQALLAELISPEGGGLRGIGQEGGVATFDYLVDMVTMVIFTASAQHAAVNFPQNDIMSFTPAMPLAAYAAAPMSKSGIRDDEVLSHLPPLQQAAIQLLGLYTLGGVYYSRLGDYDRNIRGSYFTDPRVSDPLNAFQQQLFEVEKTIGKRNQERTPYVTLLPSSIPQSINI